MTKRATSTPLLEHDLLRLRQLYERGMLTGAVYEALVREALEKHGSR